MTEQPNFAYKLADTIPLTIVIQRKVAEQLALLLDLSAAYGVGVTPTTCSEITLLTSEGGRSTTSWECRQGLLVLHPLPWMDIPVPISMNAELAKYLAGPNFVPLDFVCPECGGESLRTQHDTSDTWRVIGWFYDSKDPVYLPGSLQCDEYAEDCIFQCAHCSHTVSTAPDMQDLLDIGAVKEHDVGAVIRQLHSWIVETSDVCTGVRPITPEELASQPAVFEVFRNSALRPSKSVDPENEV